MGVYAGPDVSESGLVLALDGANYKSFKGEATTNEIVSVTWSGDGSAQSGMSFGSSAVTEEYLKYNGYETYLWSPGTSLNCYLNGADLSASRTSTVWTFSCYVKREDGAAITSLSVYMYYPNSDGSAAGTIQNVGNGWYRVSRTRTGTSNYISLAGFTGFTAGYKYYLSGAQLEKKSYTTTVVATNTTRGTTVATGGGWADLTGRGNNGELQNGVRESSDNLGALVFDGSNDRVIIPTISLGNGNLPWTCTAWVKTSLSENSLGYGSVLSNSSGGPVYSMMGVNNGKIVYWTYQNSAWAQKLGIGKTISDNNWHFLSWVNYSNYTMDMYVDGSLDSNVANSTSGNNNPINIIGASWAAAFPANIAQVQIYSRALSAQEVQQNFNATRSRFGI